MSLLKVIPLGGAGEIGKNCTVVEFGDDMILIDCGISFPHEDHYGVDIIIPDLDYVIENRHRLKGIFITHAHEDHIGALAYLLPHVDCPIYASPLADAFIRIRLEERARIKKPNITVVSTGKKYEVGKISVEPVRVTHSIPETLAMAVHTPHGIVLFTADFKIDANPVDRKPTDIGRLTALGEEGVLLLVSDSTNVEREGWSMSEGDVTPGLQRVIGNAPGRVIVTMFSSNIHRMQQICNVSKKYGRYITVAGRRIEQTFQMCRRLGYLHLEDKHFIPIEDAPKYQPQELTIIATGSQGEPRAALSQMSRAEYSRLKVIKGDTIVYSARPIPGNEGPIWRTVNRLVKLGAHVEIESDVHASGHGHKEEIRMMYRLTKPFYVAPVHGEPRHQQLFNDLLNELGHPEHRHFTLSNGDVLNMDDQKAWVEESAVQAGDICLDQDGHNVISDEILRQRHALANDGIFLLNLRVDKTHGSIDGRPKAVTHGFVGHEDSVEDILEDLRAAIAKLSPAEIAEPGFFKAHIEDIARKIVWKRSYQRPVVIANVELV